MPYVIASRTRYSIVDAMLCVYGISEQSVCHLATSVVQNQ